MSFDKMVQGFDEVEPNFGYDDEPLATAWYPVRLERVLEAQTSQGGSHGVRVQLVVNEGVDKGRRAFVNVSLTPSTTNQDGTERSEAEMNIKYANLQKMTSALMKSLELVTGDPGSGTELEKAIQFFRVNEWEGRDFMAYVKRRPETATRQASNQLNGYRPLSDPKKGLDAWRLKQGSGTSQVTGVAAAEI